MASLVTGQNKRQLVAQLDHIIETTESSSQVTSREPSLEADIQQTKKSKSELTSTNVSKGTSKREFAPDASIVLIGIRGTGKSSLAVIASTALGFRLIDGDQYFYEHTKLSRVAFKTKYGSNEYRRRETQIMRAMLSDHRAHCVIACGPGSVEGSGRAMLLEYAKSHPVIHILRDTEDIQHYLQAWSIETLAQLIDQTSPAYRASSNFEFYNLSELGVDRNDATAIKLSISPPSLTLKNIEQSFLRLLRKCVNPAVNITEREARHALASVPPEIRPFTYALQLPLSFLLRTDTQPDNLDTIADAVEFIIDQMSGDVSLDTISRFYYMIRRITRLPIIFTVASELLDPSGEGLAPQTQQLEQSYFELLHHGLRLAPEYLSVDIGCSVEHVRAILSTKGLTKIIGHHSSPQIIQENWQDQTRKGKLRATKEFGFDLIRLCQNASSMADNLSVQQFLQDYKNSNDAGPPLIAYNYGLYGRLSCWLNSVFSPVTHDLIRATDQKVVKSGLLTVQEAQNALYASFTLNKMYFGVYGETVAASLSPAIHNAAFKYCGMPHDYQIFLRSSLDDINKFCQDSNFGGVSISAPFKMDILAKIDILSPDARAIGAVNTLIPLRSTDPGSLLERNHAGPVVALYGENTDWVGIHTCIRRNLSPINAVTAQTSALILGAGGMARAAVYALLRLGVQKIFVYNRTSERAEELAEHLNQYVTREMQDIQNHSESTSKSNRTTVEPYVKILASMDMPWPSQYKHPTIIVSCVPAHSQKSSPLMDMPVPAQWLESSTGGVAVELGYDPLNTALLKQIRSLAQKGWIAVDGLQVLPEQAISQFEVFTGRKAPHQLMRNLLLQYYTEREHNSDSDDALPS